MAYQEFEFVNHNGSFVPLLKRMLSFTEAETVQREDAAEQLLFQAKIILTELLTNAIKHSATDKTCFHIRIENHTITLMKTDTGQPLDLLNRAELAIAGQFLILTSDVMHTLQVTADAMHTLHFTCIENDWPANADFSSIGEHFGLLIIAKAANRFCYRFDEAEGKNIFVAELDV